MTTPDLSVIQAAIQSWVVAGSGLASGQVIFGQQNGPAPVGQWAEIRIMSIHTVGQDWQDVEDASSPVPGADLLTRSRGVREGSLRIQCFDAPGVGNSSPLARLLGVAALASMPSRVMTLREAGFGVLGLGQVQSVDGKFGSAFQPRATLDVNFSCTAEITELGTWIQTAEIQQVDEHDDPVGPVLIAGTLPTLAPPTSMAAMGGHSQITLSWVGATGADSYNVYRGTAPGVTHLTGALRSSSAQAPYVDSTSNGIPYYYVVTSNNHLLPSSAESSEVSATSSP